MTRRYKADIRSTEINHCRAGLKRAVDFLIRNGFNYNGGNAHSILNKEFERLTGLKKPEGLKFRKWMGELYRQGSPFLTPVPNKDRKSFKKRSPKKVKKISRREEYENYIKGPIWREFREKAFDFYGRNCSTCGSVYNLHVHHKHYKTFMKEQVGDVMILCETCHEAVHGRKFTYN